MSDQLIEDLVAYAQSDRGFSALALKTAKLALLDAIGCGLLALRFPACKKLLGACGGVVVSNGVKVFGTGEALDITKAAFDIGTMIRWLDYNDTWLAAEWGHPSDNLGAILAASDFVTRVLKRPLKMGTVLRMMIKAYEVQGVMALNHAFNRVGLDHVLLVKLASVAALCDAEFLNEAQMKSAISQCFVDGQALRTYRHAPNTGSRKSWAAGDACARAIFLIWTAMRGEEGFETPITTPIWGFQDVLFKGKPLKLAQPLDCYVMENILFKISFPAEFHAQTAVEAAVMLHADLQDKLDAIDRIEIETHESAMRIISKKGPLNNPADRDHCLEYMTAVGLLYGNLSADNYEDAFAAAHPEIDRLREKMFVTEDKRFTQDYLDPTKRSIANRITVHLKNGEKLGPVTVEYPVGHKRRRAEGEPLLLDKFKRNAGSYFPAEKVAAVMQFFERSDFENCAFQDFYQLLF